MNLVEKASEHIMGNYGQRDMIITRGQGSRVWDQNDKEYLDFLGGIAVNNVGHNHPEVIEAIHEQSSNLVHCSNVFLIEKQIELAEILCNATELDKVFYGNSGTEVTEGALKLARRWAMENKGDDKHTILCFEGSFHGRSYGAISATWSEKVRTGFGPLLPGFKFAKLNNLSSVDEVWDDSICAVLVESVQGEGGIHPASKEFMQGLQQRCKDHKALLMMDEIQCGFSRTGYKFSYQHGDISPDVCLTAKAIGGGLPLGALIVSDKVADVLQPGSHGSTFGGNPVACAAGVAVCNILFEEDFVNSVRKRGHNFWKALEDLKKDFPDLVDHVRGPGLMLGLQLKTDGTSIPAIGRKHGLLFNCTQGSVLRFLPPLNTPDSMFDQAISLMKNILNEFQENQG